MLNTVVLLARMRSGTTALREVLATNPQISQFGEIFHSEYLDRDKFFYNYFLKRVSGNADFALPSGDNRRVLFKEYLEEIRRNLGCANADRVLVIGINYNSLHSLNSYWQNPLSPPYLLDLVKMWNFGILHLVRQNLLQTLVSERRARASGVWHIKSEQERASIAIEIDPETLLPELEEREEEVILVNKWVSGYCNLLNLTYEETFEPDNTINDAVLARCAKFFGVSELFQCSVPLRRTGLPTLRQQIANYRDVTESLLGTKFSKFLDP